MMGLGRSLKEMRESLGFKTAKSFHSWLASQTRLDCNYSYYSRIEKDQVLPSPGLVETLATLLPTEQGNRLVLLYCATLFPNRKKLFPTNESVPELAPIEPKTTPTPQGTRSLSPKQIATLSRSKSNYLLFLLSTLARTPLAVSAIESRTASKTPLKKAYEDLKSVKLIRGPIDAFLSSSTEMRFPKAETRSLQEAYRLLDQWDQELASELGLKKHEEKFLFRRISPRFLEMITRQASLMIELIRSAEDVDAAHNQEVVSFSLKIHSGNLPG